MVLISIPDTQITLEGGLSYSTGTETKQSVTYVTTGMFAVGWGGWERQRGAGAV